MINAEAYLFEKMYLQCAHISILEEAVAEARKDLSNMFGGHLDSKVKDAIEKIDIAYKSIDKLKIESAKK